MSKQLTYEQYFQRTKWIGITCLILGFIGAMGCIFEVAYLAVARMNK